MPKIGQTISRHILQLHPLRPAVPGAAAPHEFPGEMTGATMIGKTLAHYEITGFRDTANMDSPQGSGGK